jgi:phosphomevalonate kinase
VSAARAPGKLVLSGAYAVLSGAPALVAAVDRYALADAARRATFLTPEVNAALAGRPAPWFDASALRDGEQKLGLGSSAAILVASLAALELSDEPALSDAALCARVYERAFVAHRTAQGGGSGVDVAASAHGGVLSARRTAGGSLELTQLDLPSGLCFDVWACSVSASTSAFLARIAEYAARDPAAHAARINAQADAAEAALSATERGSADDFVAAIARQVETLTALGQAAGVSIVTPELAELARLARAHGAAFLPAGAGGGDVAYWVGADAPPESFAARARMLGLSRVQLGLGARGVHALLQQTERRS